MSIRWDSESDWEDNQDSSGITGRNGNLKQGYSRERPELSDGLVGYWPLHDSSATDYSGNGNHGNLNGGVTTGVAGKGGLQAYSFDGNDNWIDLGDWDGYKGAYTNSAWVKFPSTTPQSGGVILRGSWGAPFGLGYDANGDIYATFNIDGNYYSAKYSIPSSTDYHHICQTYEPSTGYGNLYVDGSDVASIQQSGTPDQTSSLNIGYNENQNDYYFKGDLCSVRHYHRSLSASEIQTLYKWGSGDYARPPTDGVAHYKLDGDAKDSWNSNNGTANGGLTWTNDAIRGQAASFDGSEKDYIDTNRVGLGTSSATISTWVKFDSIDGDDVIFGAYDGNDDFLAVKNNDSSGQWQAGAGKFGNNVVIAETSVGNGPLTGEWYHIVAVVEKSKGKVTIYINGSAVASMSGTIDNFDGIPAPYIGGRNNSSSYDRGMDGHIDDLRIYDRALRPEEIFELYRYGTRGRDMRKQLVNH